MENSGEVIRSRQNRTVVEVAKLTDRKAREAAKCFRFDGIKLLEEAVKNRLELRLILFSESKERLLRERLTAKFGESVFQGVERILTLSDEVFEKISEEKSPEGVICVAKYIDKFQKIVTIYNDGDFFAPSGEQVVLLESVRDPSNVGAIIRSAAAMGVDRLILSSDCADIYHPRTVRASMGTLFNQRIDRVDDLPRVIESLRRSGRTVYAAALDQSAVRLGSFPCEMGDCVVIGNEGHGLSQAVIDACDRSVFIPMSDRAESYNAAVAAAILMWEFYG